MEKHRAIAQTRSATAVRRSLLVLAAAAVAVVWARRPDGSSGGSALSAPVRWFEVARGPHGNVES
jgi:hypothetical protein